ncbi:hypothetical protein A0H81_04478 [Grifola frondosa]|uniref:Uncharacterized protein n=1 Tax=Grifola frondosa TaxID=5627 RepID=A0A1C7MKV6_GRIFR|nr:hypothetical protein A0H81_04478 [Grifola frondosa]
MITSRLWTILDEIYYAATRAFHEFVPPPANQELLTWKTAPNALAFLIPYFFMAYLVRRKNTRLIRMLLLPTLIAMALRCTYRYRCEDPRFGWFDWDRGLGCWTCIAKSLDFAFVGDGRFKVGEKQLRRSNDPARPRTRGSSSESDETHDDNSILGRLPACLVDALEVGLTLRGIGWDFGHSLYVPKSTRPSERQAFIKSTIFVVIRNFLIVDVCDTIIKLVPGITPMGGTIFLPSLPFFLRYTFPPPCTS